MTGKRVILFQGDSITDEACQRADASYWLWDGVHPTAAGHELIARQWLSVVLNSKLAIF